MWLPTVDFESTASAVSPPRHREDEAALAAEDEIVPEPLVTGQAGDWKGILHRSALANWTGSLGSVLSLLPIGWRNTVN